MEGEKKSLNFLVDISLKNEDGVIYEPYGSCMGFDPNSKKYYVISPLENGLIFQHEITSQNGILKGELRRTIGMGNVLNRKQDAITIEMILKGVLQEYLEGEFTSDELNDEV